MTPEARQDALARCDLFAELEPGPLARLADRARLIQADDEQLLFSEGDTGDGLWIVVSGIVRVWITDAEGHALTLALQEPGDMLGEMSLIDGAPRSAFATALGASDLLFLDASEFRAVLAEEPSLALHLLSLLAERLRRGNAELRDLAYAPLRARLSRKLLDLALGHAIARGDGAIFTRAFSQAELAQMLGASREAVNRQLRAMIHDGALVMEDGKIAVPSLKRLEVAARL
ncbi:Crp/Fnr family transcriptional regulator [Litorisediminicola beolgyonensis]|uniref:Crp/Fnr family transcriptional regulator n=1 Tax=Litorisediminicola beolgyonensis TaxID=1173614 RepID=A0ABW3ZEI9_9RHOB